MAAGKKEEGKLGFTIVYQILLTMLLLAAIPLGGLWYISIYKAEEDWTTNIYQSLANNSQSLAQLVDEWATMNLRLLEQNSHLADIVAMEAVQQNPVLKSITDTYPWIYLAFTVQPDGQNVGRSDGKETLYYGDRDYFRQVMGGKEVGQQLLMGKTSGKPAYILAKPINSERGKQAGVLAIAMSLEELSETVTKTRIGQSGFAILVDDENRLIAHGKGDVPNDLKEMNDHPVLQYTEVIDGNSYVFDYEGKKIVGYKQKTNMGWTLVVQQDYKEAYAAAAKSRQNAFTLLGLTLVVVLAVAYLLAQRLSTPIRNLTTLADEISRGNLGKEIKETTRGDEIGALARAIERMGVSLQMAFDRLRKKK